MSGYINSCVMTEVKGKDRKCGYKIMFYFGYLAFDRLLYKTIYKMEPWKWEVQVAVGGVTETEIKDLRSHIIKYVVCTGTDDNFVGEKQNDFNTTVFNDLDVYVRTVNMGISLKA